MADACAELHDVAPELALGVLVGAERGRALNHLAGCAGCRQLVDELSAVADSLLLLSREADAPLGFESRVLVRLGADRRRRRPWRWVATAAAVIVVAAATAIGVHLLDGRGDELHMRSAALHAGDGRETGDLYVVAGHPAWVFMSVESTAAGQRYVCELTFGDGRTVRAGEFTIADRDDWWGVAVKAGVDDLRSVRLLAPDGSVAASAEID